MSQFYNPVRLYFEANGIAELASRLVRHYGAENRVLVLTRGSEVEKSHVLMPIMKALEGTNVYMKELQLSNPDLTDIIHLTKELKSFDYELVIAIGGGSVMDMAKALIAMKENRLTSEEDLREAITEERYLQQENVIPWIGIPTTSGTGSEVTSWATVWDKEKGVKYSISNPKLYARYALIVPELTQSMPLRLSVITSLDALCHATEAYWSVRTNPITRSYALHAIERIVTYLPLLKEDAHHLECRKQLAMASVYAGLAFSNTMTTACHSISYPLTLIHGIEHGIAASITLGAVFKLNQHNIVEIDSLLKVFGVEAPADVQRKIIEIYEGYQISTQLRDYGVTSKHIEELAERAYTKGRMNNNPVIPSKQQVEALLMALL
ncbi:hypothetical protein BK133_28010 [Paenibacillus sp. FSL H8-0548]|uniref:phosphonoacetaldehyde reductase n=1 Tax=Paenibacillus sp. FSL H8-0548 TaxID=1920422 RepID=UPI00096C2B97|nr:phosphonoacetaldehyde reductase [Paenibacillus sp. FSL H8-0548]OMF21642.1 hypothetical protein BK133_28010 [Paenibacillus sp. FSL H8-0548]